MIRSHSAVEATIRELFSFDKRLYFILLCLFTFLLLLIKKNFIESEIAAFEVLEEKGQMGIFHLISGLQYFAIPVIYLLKFTFFAFILWVGCFMFGYKIVYSKVWQIIMIAETIFLVPEMLKIFWFFFFETDPTYWDVRAFYPFSLMNLVDYETIPERWHLPLKQLNIFEVMYWFILVVAIHMTARKKLSYAYGIVFGSYVLFFFMWLVFYVIVYK
ncbi:hypothetical protein QQ008_19385 [Fulvivirgaceae bacterium BMA10]|uniref:Sulfate ABC transporter permease n=1 Tax=Splendidivirga corallicola TaxID=3051826 RepID=A0ABT8KS12_9BACT|nr:hypothetical protein [Fulvivirgaceae bacterium BMA10]